MHWRVGISFPSVLGSNPGSSAQSKYSTSELSACLPLSFYAKVYLTKLARHLEKGEVSQGPVDVQARLEPVSCEARKYSEFGPLYRRAVMHGGLQVLVATLSAWKRTLGAFHSPGLPHWRGGVVLEGRQGGSGLAGPGYFGG